MIGSTRRGARIFVSGGTRVGKIEFLEGQILKEKIEVLAQNLYHPFEF